MPQMSRPRFFKASTRLIELQCCVTQGEAAAAVPVQDAAEAELAEEEALLAAAERREAAAAAAAAEVAGGGNETEEEEEPEEENVGQWSPRPLDAEHVVGQDVIPEEEDARLLELLRAQVSLPGKALCLAVSVACEHAAA